MDKRKLMRKNSLIKNLQADNQSCEKLNSVNSNKQTNCQKSKFTIQHKINTFNDENLSDVETSILNSQSTLSNNLIKNRKRSFCDSENDLSVINDSTANDAHLKNKLSISKRQNSQILIQNMPFMTSQRKDNQLSNNNISEATKSLNTTDSLIKNSLMLKRKTLSHDSTDSESNLGYSPKKHISKKKKHSQSVMNRNTQHITHDDNINSDSPRKIFSLTHESPVRIINKSNISQKRTQDKPKRFHSDTVLENSINNEGSINEPTSCATSILSNLLQKCEITLSDNGVYTLNALPSIVKRKIIQMLNLKQYQKKDIIDSIEKYTQSDNFVRMLNNMELSVENKGLTALNSVSLARILLEVTEIQTDVYNIFVSKLNDSVLLADTPEKVPWAISLLQQFRFLDTITSIDTLTTNIEQLLETCPVWFQRELILFLPDILFDSQHQNIAEVITKMMEENCELTNVILNCIASFNLDKEYLENYKVKILNLLKTNIKVEYIPAVIRFLFNDCASPNIVKQLLLVLRNIELQPLAGDNIENCYKNQVEIIKALKICMLLNKDMPQNVITVIKDINKDPKPLDLIILFVISSGTIKQKNAEALLMQNIRCGFYRISLLHTLYNDYKVVIRELQPSTLQLAGKLLKSEERVFINFATEWFRLQFLNQKDILFKQREIIEKVILLMGNNDQTVKHALSVLCKMAENTIEKVCLVSHCNHLRILLEKIDCFGLEEIGILSDLLHSLCLADDSTSESLRDDLFILLQKQLSAAKPITKCKGVMGAVMAIKHLAKNPETCDQASKLFNKVMKCVKSCSKSQPLFYDQLAQVITQTEFIDMNFLKKINDCITDEFINTYLTDKQQSSEDLVPKFGLNNTEDDPQGCIINFGNKRAGPIAPILFRLLKTCCEKLSTHGELGAIDALLGCEIFMPSNFDIPDSFVLDFIICGINWLREVITGFVTQTDPLLRRQVLKRLDTLIYLQDELNILLGLCDTKYQPPPCYFHYFPLPQFVKIEKKSNKKGKKSKKGQKSSDVSMIVEYESWEAGSTLCLKNPAYFRKFDAKIAHLLDIKIGLQLSQHKTQGISIKQVCFLIKELLALLENEPSESFMKDLIHLLPKICSKLDDIVNRLRQDDSHSFREGARLLLCLLTTIFNWKGFLSITYNTLLREGLRSLAKQVNEENSNLRSCKELVAESYKYFDSLSDIATEISLATALVNICQALMKHSETYTQQCKGKHAKLAYGFLCLQWPENKHIGLPYKSSVINLLDNWIDNEPLPLNAVTLVLEWLPEDISNLENMHSSLTKMPAINRGIFYLLYKKLFEGLIKGTNISLSAVNSDSKRIKIWHSVATNVQKLVQICKNLKLKTNIRFFVRYMPQLIKQFLINGMPILEHNLKYQTDDVTNILKMMQGGTRYLHAICCDCTEKKDLIMSKYVPVAKSVLEKLIYSVKGMLVLNDSAEAFWMGNLVNKDLEGHEIFSQMSEEVTLPDVQTTSEELVNASSEIIISDLDEDLSEEEVENADTDVDDL